MKAHRAALILGAGILNAMIMPKLHAAAPEELTFKSGDVQLSGTLYSPVEPAKVGIVLIHGSSRADSLRMSALGRLLADQGFAVFTYDKRGTGRSGGTFQSTDDEGAFNVLADDAVNAFKSFSRHSRAQGTRVGLLGISQAGWVGPIAASRLPDAAFMVLWSGPVCTVSEELHFSAKAKTIGNFSMRSHQAIIRAHMRSAPIRSGDFDPREVLSRLTLPILWIYGGRDNSIPVQLSIERIEAMIETGHKNFEFQVYDDQGHGLDYPTEYPNGFEPMVAWIGRVATPERQSTHREQ